MDDAEIFHCYTSLLSGDTADLTTWIEIALWITSIAGVLSMKKWGFAFANLTLSYTLSTSSAQCAVATIIATTSPTKVNAGSLVFLIDATVVHNSVAAASATAAPQLQANN